MRSELNDMVRRAASWAGAAALDLIAPKRCPVNGDLIDQRSAVGPKAWADLHLIEPPYCARCGAPFAVDINNDVECAACIAESPVFDQARAALVYDEFARRLVGDLKFRDRTDIAPMLGRWMARAGADLLSRDSILVPVPLHWRRRLSRRFNQSAMLAQHVAHASGARVLYSGLKRHRATPPQRESSSAEARKRNVAGAFSTPAKTRAIIEGADVVLIDDVLTSGATLSAAARALRRGGAAKVDALALARVVKGGVGAI